MALWKDGAAGHLALAGLGTAYVWDLAWSPDGARLATAGGDGHVGVWDTTTGTLLASCRLAHPVTSLAWTPDGERLVLSGWRSTLALWTPHPAHAADTTDSAPVALSTPFSTVYGVAVSPDGSRVAVAGEANEEEKSALDDYEVEGLVAILDLATRTTVLVYRGHRAIWTNAVAWSPDGELLASAGDSDSTVCIWRARTGHTVSTCTFSMYSSKQVFSVAWSPDGELVAAGTHWGLRIYEARTGLQLRQVAEEPDTPRVSWSPDGALLAAVHSPGLPSIYDAATCKLVYEYTGHPETSPWRGVADAVAWSPDGARVATAAVEPPAVHIWARPMPDE